MIAQQTCPKCGTPLSKGSLAGLCRRCLARLGFEAAPSGNGEGGAAAAAFQPGRTFGDYELLEEIARGGMGVVYKARQLGLNRVVAVKMVLHGPFSSEEFVRRFQTEAEAAASLSHPNIVAIYEIGRQDGQHYFSMEYIDGKNLGELVREKPLAPRRAAGYLRSIALAMHYAHQKGVLHRDLKPSNVLLDPFDQPRITDFGLAKLLNTDSQLTLTGQALGSPGHMPPEQAGGDRGSASPRGDIYSLGAILYHLVTGRPPFQGETIQDVLLQAQAAEPVAPIRLNPSVPVDLQTICLKCLQKEPARRYASAQELAEDLGRFLAGEPILARPVSPAQKLILWCRRHPGPAALSSALILAVVLGVAGVVVEWGRAERHAKSEAGLHQLAEDSSAKLRLNLYAADMSVASQALQRGDYGLARRTLQGLAPAAGQTDLRGFEWRYLWNLCRGQELATLTGHSWIVTCSAFSPDGRLLATGSQDGAANVWDVDRRERITTLGTPPDGVWSVGFSPEGDLLMTAADRAVSLYSTATWQLITNFPGQIAVLSKTGSLLAVSESNPFRWERVGPVSLWDYHTMRKLREFGQPGRALALSPDGRQLAAGGKDTGVYLWNTASGELLRTLPTDQSVWSMAFSPDGKRLTTAGWSSEALVWDLEAREPPARIKGHALNVWSANFSPDGATIVTTSSDQTIRSWDAQSLLAKDVFRGHDNEVWCAAFRPDGKMMATGGKDRTVRMWPAQLPPQKRDLPAQNGIRPYFSPDGTRIGLAGPAANGWHPQVWDVEQRKAIADVPDGLLLGFSPDGRVVRLNEESMSLDSWAPTNSTVSSVKLDGIEPGKVKLVRAGFSPDRKFLFALDTHGVAGVWEAATGKSVGSAKGPSPPFRATALGLGGKWLAISLERDNPVRLYETRTGRETLLSGHHDFVSGLAFSPDGASLATGSMDATIRLWDLNTGKHFATFAGHLEEVTDLAFAPDGRTLASLGQRDSFKLWHLATQRELLSWNIPNAGLFLMFSPDGKRLAVTTGNNSLRLFEAPAEISQ